MNNTLIEVEGLTVSVGHSVKQTNIVKNVGFKINCGETFVLLGESGSGKSITALSVMRLLPPTVSVTSGKILFNKQNLFKIPERDMRDIRGASIGMIFQEPQTSLNPVLTVGQQIREVLFRHKKISKKKCIELSIELLDCVGISAADQCINKYPHQFSGGMKQRVMIAIALGAEPDLLIADEPTTALDVTTQAKVLSLLKDIQKRTGMTTLFITHDLGVASQIADHVAVMKQGVIVETKEKNKLFTEPEDPYTLQLFDAVPSWEKRLVEEKITDRKKHLTTPLLKVSALRVYYPIKKGLFKKVVGNVKAVDDVSLDVYTGETIAIVGESGSGKTTMGKGILRLLEITKGNVQFDNTDLIKCDEKTLKKKRSDVQIIFQDPYSSMNPRMMVRDIIQEGMLAQEIGNSQKERDQQCLELLEQVALLPEHLYRYPHEFSGGQRQRICIARALAVKPKLIVFDEPTSALDVSVQAQILVLLAKLQKEYNLTYLFITHNISVVEYIADYVAVMYRGKLVEQGKAEQILKHPKHSYTKKLLEAVPRIKDMAG